MAQLRCVLRTTLGAVAIAAAFGCFAAAAQADPVSGAIFTTLPNGSEVNFNIYSSKLDVYLNGGPGPGAPSTAAGLPDGSYVFQVTDPSGKTLLSTDPAGCRQFTVSGGQINGVVAYNSPNCQHVTGIDVDEASTTVQLMPYNDTPNPGGEYKVWATSLANYLQGCAGYGVTNGLAVVNCGAKSGSDVHGFIPSDSKTDNFKVGPVVPQEIDTRFFDSGGNVLDGFGITWTDPSGASNHKWSYYAPSLQIFHEAHVEDVTQGTNLITVANQPGCTVGEVDVLGSVYGNGPMTVAIKVTGTNKTFTYRVDVHCL
ncbi:MAG TPA: hypothetical protein VG321_02435 [Solirubrobacteraceae bacterium]|nr:hypothetical protein [Solirubrobacteraceae bacterium]